MNKPKIHDSDIIDPVSDYFREFDYENWKRLKRKEARIVDFLRIDNIDIRIKGSVVDKY
jgi:hypothetical protein